MELGRMMSVTDKCRTSPDFSPKGSDRDGESCAGEVDSRTLDGSSQVVTTVDS